MEDPLPVNQELTIPGDELGFTASRAGGHGGQHVNKVSSRVTLRWAVGQSCAVTPQQRARLLRRLAGRISADGFLAIHVDATRSQHQNRQIARQRLAELVGAALRRRKTRVPTRVPGAVRRQRLADKRQRARRKHLRRPPSQED